MYFVATCRGTVAKDSNRWKLLKIDLIREKDRQYMTHNNVYFNYYINTHLLHSKYLLSIKTSLIYICNDPWLISVVTNIIIIKGFILVGYNLISDFYPFMENLLASQILFALFIFVLVHCIHFWITYTFNQMDLSFNIQKMIKTIFFMFHVSVLLWEKFGKNIPR